MSLTEKIQVVVISVIIALALAGGLYVVLPGQRVPVGAGDDAPILIAGGSLFLGTHSEFQLKASLTGNALQFADLKGVQVFDRYVNSIDSIDATGGVASYPASGAARVEINYTGNDTITLEYDPATHYITITNTDTNHYISKTHRVLTNLRARKGGKIQNIDLFPDGSTPHRVDCGADGECSVTVHTCGLTGSGACQ